MTPHREPCEGQVKGQRSLSPVRLWGERGCAVHCPSEQGTDGVPRALSCSPCPDPGPCFCSPSLENAFPCYSPGGKHGLHPSPARTLGCDWAGVDTPRQFLPCAPAAFSFWDGLSQLGQPQRGSRRWCEGVALLQGIPGVTPNRGENG